MAVQNPSQNPPPTVFGDGVSTVSSVLKTTATDVDGGVDAVAGVPKGMTITVVDTWATDDRGQVIINDTLSNLTYVLGDSDITGVQPSFCLTLKGKVYVTGGGNLYFSEVADPTEWDDPEGIGNGNINLSLGYALPENLIAVAAYQGKIAIFGKEATQIYSIATNPADYDLLQVLPNLGAIASESVKSLGNLDVLMLAYNGVRSLRVRDSSLNGMTVDIGSPIDQLIKAKLQESSAEEIAAACAVVDPDSGRYWLFIKDTIYVLSYFEGAQVTAWSTYLPQTETPVEMTPTVTFTEGTLITDRYTVTPGLAYRIVFAAETSVQVVNGGVTSSVGEDTTIVALSTQLDIVYGIDIAVSWTVTQFGLASFVPYRFETHKGLVYARTLDAIALYGDTDGNTYDSSVATWETPWLSNKEPATRKMSDSIGATYSGRWNVSCGLDFKAGTLDFVFQTDDTEIGTQEDQTIAYSAEGTHFRFRGQTADSDAATLSSFIFKYRKGDQK